jgi:hypothetical protein
MADIFDELLAGGVHPSELAAELRRQKQLGEIGMLSGSSRLGPLGKALSADALGQAGEIRDARHRRDEKASDREHAAGLADLAREFQAGEHEKNRKQQREQAALNRALSREIAQGRASSALEAARIRAAAAGKGKAEKGMPTPESSAQAWNVYKTAREALGSGFKGAMGFPGLGYAPPMTPDQQEAEGGRALVAPILKQMFRVAGEGIFTDKDQELLLGMVPSRNDFPSVRKTKLENMDRLIRAKLAIDEGGNFIGTQPTGLEGLEGAVEAQGDDVDALIQQIMGGGDAELEGLLNGP